LFASAAAGFSAWHELAAPSLVDPDLESPVRWSPYAHQRRVCACGLYSWNFLGLDFCKNKFAARGIHVSLLDRWRRDLPVRHRGIRRRGDGIGHLAGDGDAAATAPHQGANATGAVK